MAIGTVVDLLVHVQKNYSLTATVASIAKHFHFHIKCDSCEMMKFKKKMHYDTWKSENGVRESDQCHCVGQNATNVLPFNLTSNPGSIHVV